MEHLYEEAKKEVLAPFQKVPGQVKPMGRLDHEEKTFKESISKMSLPQLKDLLARQDAILSNKRLLEKLPDKGHKIREKKKEIQDLMEKKSSQKDLSEVFEEKMKLVDTEKLEWRPDPLRILAEKEVPDKEYVEEFVKKFDDEKWKKENSLKNAPFKQVKRNELDEKAKGKINLKRNLKENPIKSRKVEVMPLPPANYERLKVQQIDLKESLELQKNQMKNLKEVKLQNAIGKLMKLDKHADESTKSEQSDDDETQESENEADSDIENED